MTDGWASAGALSTVRLNANVVLVAEPISRPSCSKRAVKRSIVSCVEIAQIDREHDLPRDHVRRVRRDGHAPDRRDLPARLAPDRVVHADGELRRGEHRVLPLVHRRRAGVVRDAGDRHLEPAESDDPLARRRSGVRPAPAGRPARCAARCSRRRRPGCERRRASRRTSPPIRPIPSRIVLPERATLSRSASARSPITSLLPIVPPSSFCQTTTSSGWRSRTPCSQQRPRDLDGAERCRPVRHSCPRR